MTESNIELWERIERRPRFYLLKGRKVEAIPNGPRAVLTWGMKFEFENRQVELSQYQGVTVSTVFLGLDRAYDGPPMIFETMAFSEAGAEVIDRYSTWDEAAAGHKEVLAALQRAMEGVECSLSKIGRFAPQLALPPPTAADD